MEPMTTTQDTAAALEAWLVASLPWLGAALLLAVSAGVVGVFLIVRRFHDLERLASRLDALEDLKVSLGRLADAHGDLEVRRIEHLLIEIRDGQRRVEDRLLRAVEAARTPGSAHPTPGGLSDRVIDRLLALGYERVQLITPVDELPADDAGEGEVRVEAHRNGVLCKGRVRVRDGALVDVELKPAYTAFP
jgi:hypothetical protein